MIRARSRSKTAATTVTICGTDLRILDGDVPAGRRVANRQLDTSPMMTHSFSLADFETAYDVFGCAADAGAVKVLLTAAGG